MGKLWAKNLAMIFELCVLVADDFLYFIRPMIYYFLVISVLD